MNRIMIILTCTILVGGLYYERAKLSRRAKQRQREKAYKIAQASSGSNTAATTRTTNKATASSTRSHFQNNSFGKSFKSTKTYNWSGDMTLKSSKFGKSSSKKSQTNKTSSGQKADASAQKFLDSTKEMQKNPGLSSSVKAFKNYAKYIEDESSR